jgi:hypothetical protein
MFCFIHGYFQYWQRKPEHESHCVSINDGGIIDISVDVGIGVNARNYLLWWKMTMRNIALGGFGIVRTSRWVRGHEPNLLAIVWIGGFSGSAIGRGRC